jgi:hypothetical protein
MEKINEFLFRPGSLGLSVLAFIGLTCLAAALWTVASGYVLLLLIPALAVSFYQMVVTPVYGLKMNARRWTVMTHDGDSVVPFEDIAHLRLEERGAQSNATLVLRDGQEVPIPYDGRPGSLDLIRAATDNGVPVRSR